MAWLNKRGNYWHVEWRERAGVDDAGKPRYRLRGQTTECENRTDAKIALARFERQQAENRRNGYQIAGAGKLMVTDPRVKDFWTAFEKKYQNEYRPSSWQAKEWAWNRLCKELAPATLSDITQAKVVSLRDSWKQSPVTFNDMMRACSGVWRKCAKLPEPLHSIPNPFDDVKQLRELRKKVDVLSFDQIEALCWHAANHSADPRVSNIWAMFVLTGYFGLRSIEAENALDTWIDFDLGLFNVIQSEHFHTKNGQDRSIPLFDSAHRWLQKFKNNRTGNPIFRPDHIIIKPKYGRVAEYRKSWDWVCTKAGLPDVYPHLLRHSWITNLLHLGASPHEVADWSGHQDLYIQQNYRHAIKPKEGRTSLL